MKISSINNRQQNSIFTGYKSINMIKRAKNIHHLVNNESKPNSVMLYFAGFLSTFSFDKILNKLLSK